MDPIPLPYRILALVALICACIGFGYVEGVSRESDRRDARQLEQKRADEMALSEALASGKRHASNAIEWRNEARMYYRKLKERLAHEDDTKLIAVMPVRVSATCNVGRDMSLSATWVGLYNAAWMPEFHPQDDTGGAADALIEAGAATPREVLDNVGTNAELCGADRKRLDELIDLLNEISMPSPQSSPASGRGGERERQLSIPAGGGTALRQADGTTSHSTRLSKDASQVAGYQGERVSGGAPR